MSDCIRIWPWPDAPDEYKRLHFTDDDMDYLAHIPASLRRTSPAIRLEAVGPPGCCAVDAHEAPDGALVLAGCHA